MFNNPLKKYQTGGTTPSQNDIQQLIQGIAKVVNQTPEYVAKQMQQIMQTQDGETMLTEAIQEYSNNPESGLTKLKQLFPGEGAQMAKLGGKIKDFICKHAKGGYVAGCGCGGNVQKGEMGVVIRRRPYDEYTKLAQDTTVTNPNRETYKRSIIVNPKTNEAIKQSIFRTDTLTVPGYITPEGMFVNEGDGSVNNRQVADQVNYLRNINPVKTQENGGVVKAQVGSSGIPTFNGNTNALNEYINGVPNSGSLFSGPAVKIYIDGLDRNLVQAQEDGGIVKAQDGIQMSRREALNAAKSEHGFNNSQAQFAYTNAKNALRKQGLRGSELKQRARQMIAGQLTGFNNIEIEEPEIKEPEIEIPTFEDYDTSINVSPIVKSIVPTNYDDMSYSKAFATAATLADKGGPKTFIWHGRTYGTRRDPNWNKKTKNEQVASESTPVISTIEPTVTNTSNTSSISVPSVNNVSKNNNSYTNFVLPGLFQSNVEVIPSNFNISYKNDKNSYGARQAIRVKQYIDGAGLGGLTEFRNGQWVWSENGIPVEIPTIRRPSGKFVPAVQKHGGIIKPNWINRIKK